MLPAALNKHATVTRLVRRPRRNFSMHNALLEKPLPPRLVIPESDMTESFLKGSGPGGQKINKTSSAVQLKHLPTGIVVKSQETRSREQNRRTARRILGEKLEQMEKGLLSRTALKAEKERKKKASASKKAKRKYRKLEGSKAVSDDGTGPDEEDNAMSVENDTTSERTDGQSVHSEQSRLPP